jgi:hypothetical protein
MAIFRLLYEEVLYIEYDCTTCYMISRIMWRTGVMVVNSQISWIGLGEMLLGLSCAFCMVLVGLSLYLAAMCSLWMEVLVLFQRL